jgi:RNA polymerase sigma-70 factor (ECF subfamily)
MDLAENIAKYRKTVFAVAVGYVKNAHDADDIAQNVFLKLHLSPKEFESEEAKKAWLIRVAINESKDLLRSAWRNNTCELDDSLIARDRDDLGLHDYLQQLKPKYRTVIFLHYYEKMPVKEIAAILKIPQMTVLTQLRRAREQLKEMIVSDREEEHCYGRI